MEWFEILKQMKTDSGMTTLEISEKSGVPEPTLEKLFSGFTKNPKLNTIIAVTHSLGRTLDDLAPLSRATGGDFMGFEIINSLKKKNGWTNEDLSQKSGVPKATIDKVTSGATTNPSFDTVKAIADALGCDIDDFRSKPALPTPVTKKIPPADESEEEDYDKTLLIENYDGMNASGKKELVKHSHLLVNSGEYKKCGEFGVDKGIA